MRIYTNNKTMTPSQYAYDALGRRIGKYDAAAMETTFYYYNDQWQILAAYDEYSSLQRYYVYGNYIDEVLMAGDGAGDLYYAHDHLYSPAALLDDTGAVVERYEYDAYGKTTIWDTGLVNSFDTSQYGNPHAFTGRQLDILDGGTLHHMHYRHRDYSPALGRFMQHDRWEYVDGMNMYLYGLANPIYYLDPMGEAAIAPIVWPAVKKCAIVVASACVGIIIGDSLPSECTPGSTKTEYDFKPIKEWDPCEGGKVVGRAITKRFYRCVRVHWALRNRGRWEIEDSQRWIEMF